MLRASRVLHDSMLERILRAPMSFFDTNPLGRILSRFSTDVDVLDNSLPTDLLGWIQDLFTVISTVIIISITTPWFLVVAVFLALGYAIIQRIFLSSARAVKRMESVAKSPIYSLFSEVLSGSTTIRVYNKQEMFIRNCEKLVDMSNRCSYVRIAINR